MWKCEFNLIRHFLVAFCNILRSKKQKSKKVKTLKLKQQKFCDIKIRKERNVLY